MRPDLVPRWAGGTSEMRIVLVLGLAAILVAGCVGSGAASPEPSATASATANPASPPVSASSAATPNASPAPGDPGSPPSSPAPPAPPATFPPAGPAPELEAGDVALVAATEGIRVRTRPSVVAGVSDRFAPLLPAGTDLYVVSGPVEGSGYWWYEVSPITFRLTGLVEWPERIVGPSSTGWVASASRDGVPWLAAGSPSCPRAPTDVVGLASLSIGARLACFAGRPLTVTARIIPCNCDVDPPAEFVPSWFAPVRDGQELVLVDPDTRSPLIDWPQPLEMQFLRLDPAGSFPDPLPIDRVVTVAGTFDHPAASDCRIRDWTDGRLVTSEICRTLFAATAIR